MKPTFEILQLTSLIEEGLTTFVEKTSTIEIGKYESVVESRIILNLCLRYFESINLLAKNDFVNLPSAMVLGRSLFESAINILWILHPDNIFECESRFLARLKKYEDWISDQIKFFNLQKWNSDAFINQKEQINHFIIALEKLLLEKGQRLTQVPNFRAMLKTIGEERKYLYYKLLSGFIHGGYYATTVYRKNLGWCKEFGEFIDVNDWKLIYSVTWPVFEISSELFIEKATFSRIKNIYSDDFKIEIRKTLKI